MPGFGSFYKGEKKKPKKNKESKQNYSSAPTYVMPEVISKKKKDSWCVKIKKIKIKTKI